MTDLPPPPPPPPSRPNPSVPQRGGPPRGESEDVGPRWADSGAAHWLPRVMVTIAVLLAVYEALAIFTDLVPTITDIVQWLPGLAELLIIGSVIGWLAWHFGWLTPGDRPPFGAPRAAGRRRRRWGPGLEVTAGVIVAALVCLVLWAWLRPDGPRDRQRLDLSDREWCSEVVWDGGYAPTGWTEAELVDDCLDALAVYSRAPLLDTYEAMQANEVPARVDGE
jgi:hypothetical protein